MIRTRAVEQAGGVAPLVHASAPVAVGERDELDRARADEYALLSSLLLRPPGGAALARLALLQGAETPLGRAHAALGEAAMRAAAEGAEREYFDLFLGVGRGELVPYASYYLTGFLNEKPLMRLREDMKRLGLERAEQHGDPEDHIGTLCEIMSGLASGCFGTAAADESGFFAAHVAPWAGRFFADLEQAEAARFYKAVGSVGRLFIDLEVEAFAMEARQDG